MVKENSVAGQAFSYRAEVDGLRAIAIIPVVLFHAGIARVTGGYIGVDVFFVISGYLITSILAREISEGQFSTSAFYERRIRRIFPALLLMFAVCSVIAAALLMPPDFRAFARSVVASGLFSSNLLFWAEGGYFDTAAELKPLLHTWSLSVEEQFYIVFPGLLHVLLTRVRHWKIAMSAIFLASLSACVFYTISKPSAAFYLPMFRVWELLAGSFVALSIGFVEVSTARLRSCLALAGLAAIGWAAFTFDSTTVFPGFHALFPCIGAALVIGYSNKTMVGTVLGAAPLVWIGKISYSLYLWHWPILVFMKYYAMRDLTTEEKWAAVCLSVLAAYVSLRFVETPFRVNRFAAVPRSLFKGALLAMSCFVLAGLTTYAANGFPGRFAANVQAMAKGASDTNPERRRCDNRTVRDVASGYVCTIGTSSARTTFAVFGDSLGDALIPGIDSAAHDAGKHGMVLTSSGCYPLAGVVDVNKRGDRSCGDFVNASIKLMRDTPSITDVILVGRWTSAALGTRFGASQGVNWFINDDQSRERSYPENMRVFDRSLTRTVELLKGKRVHIVAYIPEQPIDPPRTLALCTYLGRNCPTGIAIAQFYQRQLFVRSIVDRLAESRDVSVIDVGSKLCSPSGCKLVDGDSILYSDDNHLSRAGALYIKPLFFPVFAARKTSEVNLQTSLAQREWRAQ
ncbi:acyltransferase family protein [Massilia sp. DWR3-1-1]|uniref:acyltransferase family protein n=1 Tax=Massilia sp. DWR3-1-1 TaxID=2804559 RepID=UPI003CEB7C36